MNKIMLLGTASSVGKSTVATAFCRYFKKKGLNVSPFKALNISLNSYITEDGLEMGRAQVVQAEACEIKPDARMNPILLKPSGNMQTQVIVNGRVYCNMGAYKYEELNRELRKVVKETFYSFSKDYDLMVLEGSGSCAEINLKSTDIANMSMAEVADAPVILVADIDKGGVFASVVGTVMLLDEKERARVKGVIINKFRGNTEYFKPAMKQLEEIINIPVLGALPYFDLDIEDEDSVTERIKSEYSSGLDIAVIKLPYMSNFTDFNSLERLEGVSVRFVKEVSELKNPDLIIIPGSKNTISDLRAIKGNKLFDKILELHKKGTNIFGICGGYQILGLTVHDINEVEGEAILEEGLSLLNIETTFNKDKITKQTKGSVINFPKNNSDEINISGYEIHNGISVIKGEESITFVKDDSGEILGVCNKDRNVFGTYLHGIFDNSEFLSVYINILKEKKGINISYEPIEDYQKYKLMQYDKLVDILEANIDMKEIEEIIDGSK